MIKYRPAILFVAVGAIALITIFAAGRDFGWLRLDSEDKAVNQEKNTPLEIDVRDESGTDNSEQTSEVKNCVSESQLETHPLMMEELERLDPLVVNFGSISGYRNLEEFELIPLIEQGDSAAMAVMGAMHVMRARGLPDSSAVPYLLLEDPDLLSYVYKLPHTDKQIRHYNLAADWFYKSALNGRLLALINVGQQLNMLGKTPVDLGWISEEDCDQLSRSQKSTFNAASVYQAVAYTIAPQAEFGFIEEMGLGFGSSFAKRYAHIAEPIATKFRSDRAELGLGAITVPASALPPYSEFTELLCEPIE